MPNTPVNAAGMRIEPAPSVPMCRWPRLSSAAAAAPPDEPPGVRSSFHGLRVMPVSGECVRADPAELGQRGLAEDDRAVLAQARDRGRVLRHRRGGRW